MPFSISEITAIIGALGVIASIIYLAMQIRQNTAITRSAVYQQLASRLQDRLLMVCETPEIAALIAKEWREENLSETERIAIFYWLAAVVSDLRDVHYQCELGMVDKQFLNARVATMRQNLFQNPLARQAWQTLKTASGPEFSEWFETEVLGAELPEVTSETA